MVWRARYGRVDPTEKERLLKLGRSDAGNKQWKSRYSPNVRPQKHKIACKIAGTAR